MSIEDALMPRSVPALPGVTKSSTAYSDVVEANGLVFLAGQVGDPPGGGDLAAEARAAYQVIQRLLRAVGLDLGDVVRCTVYLRDIGDFRVADQVFREFFPIDPPARSTVGGASLVRDRRIEIEVTAAR